VAVDLHGHREVVVRTQVEYPFCIDWLPDDRLLIVSGRESRLFRRELDGSLVTHADLRGLSDKTWNEIVVDGRGNAYQNGIGGTIALVGPHRSLRRVADGLAFPNGMAVTPDNGTLIVAESHAMRLTAFEIAADGSLSNRRAWADLGGGVRTGSASMRTTPSGTETSPTSVAYTLRRWGSAADDRTRPRLFRLHARRHGQEDAIPDRRGVAWDGSDPRGRAGANRTGPDRQGARTWCRVTVGGDRNPSAGRRFAATPSD
jgi:SMP-30/Gluconolactonase/LRE-like region